MKLAKVAVLGLAAMGIAGLANAGVGDFGHSRVRSESRGSFGGQTPMRYSTWGGAGFLPPKWCDPGSGGGSGGGGGEVGVSTTPEPGTWAMLIVGAGLVAFQLRRKQLALGSFSH
ncbi:MAG: PEPxxWA-CTERM sorting domain-containing protein [Steroidobacteraceae bacterium]